MQIEIKIDNEQKEPKIIIITDKTTDENDLLIKKLSEDKIRVISGFRDGVFEILQPNDIVRIYSANQKVYVVTNKGEFTTKLRLYELEEFLNQNQFIRISNSEIINLKMIRNFDLSFTGTIRVVLINGQVTFASRRYVAKIKKVLGLWGE